MSALGELRKDDEATSGKDFQHPSPQPGPSDSQPSSLLQSLPKLQDEDSNVVFASSSRKPCGITVVLCLNPFYQSGD